MVNHKPFAFIQNFFLLVDTIYEIKYRPIFKEEHYSCCLKQFSWIFEDIPASGSSFLGLFETEFLSNPSSSLVYADFGLVLNRVLLFRAFFSAAKKALMKLGVNQFSSNFSVPNSGSSFSGYWKLIFYQMLLISTSGKGLFFKCSFFESNFRASGNHCLN